MWSLSFIKVPERVNWEDHIPRGTTEWELQSAVSKLFDVRAIWPKMSIREQLLDNGVLVTVHMLRRLVPEIPICRSLEFATRNVS